jgi:hypothetical protein
MRSDGPPLCVSQELLADRQREETPPLVEVGGETVVVRDSSHSTHSLESFLLLLCLHSKRVQKTNPNQSKSKQSLTNPIQFYSKPNGPNSNPPGPPLTQSHCDSDSLISHSHTPNGRSIVLFEVGSDLGVKN